MKRNGHKIICVIIAAALMFSALAGCGSGAKTAEVKTPDTEGTETVRGEQPETDKGSEDDPMADAADLMKEYEAMEEADAEQISDTLNSVDADDPEGAEADNDGTASNADADAGDQPLCA